MAEKKSYNNDFMKGIGVGILIVLALGFVFQNVSGGSLFSGDIEPKKVLKKGSDSGTNTNPSAPSNPSAGQPDTSEVNFASITTDDHIQGDPEAPVTLLEYSDLECPFCGRFHPTAQQIVEDNAGQVNWVYRHFPLRSIHPDAQKLAEASECVADRAGNDKFWEFIDYVFNNDVTTSNVASAANAIGVDGADIEECMQSGEFEQDVNDDYNDATGAGGRGTPYTIIIGPDGETIPLSGAVPASQVQSAIDSVLN